jgi:integrase
MSIQEYVTKSGKTRYRAQLEVGRKLDGSADRRTKVCKSLKEAQRAEREFEVVRDGLCGRSDRITFQKFVDDYYLPTKREALRKTTMRGYEGVIKNHLMPTLANCNLGDINRFQIQQLLSSRSSYKVAKNTRDALRQILGEAVQMEVIKINPASGRFTLPDKKETDHDNNGEWVTSMAEQRRIIDMADDVLRPVLVLGFCFGLRKGEILGLDWKDIDLKARKLSVRRTYTHAGGKPRLTAPKTEGSVRVIPITDYAVAKLRALRGKNSRIGAVCLFSGHRMAPYDAQKLMKRFTTTHDVPKVTCHSLRHSFATSAIRSGVPVEQVSKMLGHAKITTTYDRYVKPLQNDLQDAVKILDKAYSTG